MSGTLFLFPVPISENTTLSIPQHNIDILKSITYIIAENARTARRFLSTIGLEVSHYVIFEIDKHNDDGRQILEFMKPLFEGHDMAIMSESGCPCVADPGYIFVDYAHNYGITVKPLVGPSSILLALMASGMNGQSFCFHGYLPIGLDCKNKLKTIINSIDNTHQTQIFIETPYRNNTILKSILESVPHGYKLCIATDIQGKKESIITKTINKWIEKPLELPKLPTIFLLGD